MPRFLTISREFTFEAAHSLDYKDGTDAGYKNLHGHSFTAKLFVRGRRSQIDHWVMDFGGFDPVIADLRGVLDHTYLNDVDGLKSPTLEHLCAYIYDRAAPALPGLIAVEVARKTCGQSCRYEVE